MQRVDDINPSVLKWARETAGLPVDEAASKLGLTSSRRSSASDKLNALEHGETAPTRRQLERMSAVYRRPIVAFYRREIPPPEHKGVDFRSQSVSVPGEITGRLDALLRDVLVRHRIVKSFLEDDEDFQPLLFVGALSHQASVDEATDFLRRFFDVRAGESPGQGLASSDALFNWLRRKVESQGVFVLLMGNLGSHHTNVSEEAFRGFAIADRVAPFIVINDQDAKAARSFTLVHELVHILIGASGVSGPPPIQDEAKSTRTIEGFCNDVAGTFLLPGFAIEVQGRHVSADDAIAAIEVISQRHKVSEAMVAYRMWREQAISTEIYRTLNNHYTARWLAFKARQRESSQEHEGGPSYFVVKKHKLGQPILNLVGQAVRSNEMTYTKAAKVLGVSPNNVKKLVFDSGALGSHGGNTTQ